MKNKILIGILLLVALSLLLFLNKNSNEDTIEVEDSVESETVEIIKSEEKEDTKVKVDIKGAISKPGVYEVSSNTRVIDVIKTAGGLKKDANTNYINLSAKVVDEMVIWIYTSKEIEELKLEQSSAKYMISECNCPTVDNTTCLNSNNEKTDSNQNNAIVNINTASVEELTTLEGIGESKAKSIIEYRDKNGKFNSVEDIMNVSGIGESAYSKIKDYITV